MSQRPVGLQISALDCGTNLSHWHTDVNQSQPEEKTVQEAHVGPSLHLQGRRDLQPLRETGGKQSAAPGASGSPLPVGAVSEAADKQGR